MESDALELMTRAEKRIYLDLRERRLDSQPVESRSPTYSDDTTKKLLSLVYSRAAAKDAIEKTKPRKRKREVKIHKNRLKTIERMGFKMKAKNCQNIALVFKGASQKEAAITERFIKQRNKRRREDARMKKRSWLVDMVKQHHNKKFK